MTEQAPMDQGRGEWSEEEESWFATDERRRPPPAPSIPPDSGIDDSIFDGWVR